MPSAALSTSTRPAFRKIIPRFRLRGTLQAQRHRKYLLWCPHLVSVGSVKASRQRWLSSIERLPAPLAIFTTRPLLLLASGIHVDKNERGRNTYKRLISSLSGFSFRGCRMSPRAHSCFGGTVNKCQTFIHPLPCRQKIRILETGDESIIIRTLNDYVSPGR